MFFWVFFMDIVPILKQPTQPNMDKSIFFLFFFIEPLPYASIDSVFMHPLLITYGE